MSATAAASDFVDAGGLNAAESSAESAVSLRWFRFAAGSTPEDDYRPVGSDGVGLKLLAELAQVCVAFHPHNDIRQFPRRCPALLFFRARSTGDYVLLRVGLHPGIDGERASLEYDGLVLAVSELRFFGLNPFTPGDRGLFDRVQRAASADAAGARLAVTSDTAMPPRLAPSDADDWEFTPGTERVATEDAADAIERLCRLRASRGAPSPTFATWWESEKPVPPGYFDLILRSPSPRGPSPHAVEESATSLAADLTAVGETDTGYAFRSRVVAALRGCGKMTPPQFRAAMAEAAEDLRQIGDRLAAEGGRASFVARCRSFEDDLRKMRHPDPFAAGRFDTIEAAMRSEAAAADSRRRRRWRVLRRHRPLIAVGALALLAIAAAVTVLVWRGVGHAVR